MPSVSVCFCVRQRKALSCQWLHNQAAFLRRSSNTPGRQKTSRHRSGYTASSSILRLFPQFIFGFFSLPPVFFPPSLLSLSPLSLFPTHFFSYLCHRSRGFTLRRLVTAGPKLVSWSQDRSCFSVWKGRLCARVRADARPSSITCRDISTTKRLQSNGPINLISARSVRAKREARNKRRAVGCVLLPKAPRSRPRVHCAVYL